MLPAAFSGSPSYTLLSVCVVTLSVAGVILTVAVVFKIFSFPSTIKVFETSTLYSPASLNNNSFTSFPFTL